MKRIRAAWMLAPVALGLCGAAALGRPATTSRAPDDAGGPSRVARERPRLLDDAPAADDRDAPEDAVARERRRRGSNNGDWFRDPFHSDPEVAGGFPAYAVHDAVVANARAATAREVFRQAESALDGAVRQARRTFESTSEYREGADAERQAWQDYTKARKAAVDSLKDNPEYVSLLKLRDDLSNQIAAKRRSAQTGEQPSAYLQDILAMASLKMRYALAAGALEAEAVSSRSEVAEAREKYRNANAHLAEMRLQFDSSVRSDPDLLAARRALSDARISKLTALAYLKGAIEAADEALDFAYYLHRYDGSSAYGDFRSYYPYDYPIRSHFIGGYLP